MLGFVWEDLLKKDVKVVLVGESHNTYQYETVSKVLKEGLILSSSGSLLRRYVPYDKISCIYYKE